MVKPHQGHAPLTHGGACTMTQKVQTIHFDQVRVHHRQELLNLPIVRQDTMVRIVQKAWAFHSVQGRIEERLLRVTGSRYNDGMVCAPGMHSEITGLLRE